MKHPGGSEESGGGEDRTALRPGWLLQPGQLLAGNYRIETLVGIGGMGQVFAAEDAALRRKVAIKVPGLNILEQPGGAKRFLDEARKAHHLDGSPHIVKIIACLSGRTDDSSEPLPFIVMEYLGGGNLAGHLRNGPMPLPDAVTFFSQICLALSFAHEEGVVHRDLKPENICFDETGRLVIVDFGIARMLGESYTATMSIAGTAAYMAPEQWNPALGVDHRTDLYAAGVLFFQMLTGRLPFEGTPDQMCTAHLKQTPPNVCDLRRGIPSAIGAAISRAMEKKKARRFQSLQQFGEAVRSDSKHSGGAPEPERKQSPVSHGPPISRTIQHRANDSQQIRAAREHIANGDANRAFECLNAELKSLNPDQDAVMEVISQTFCVNCNRFVDQAWNVERQRVVSGTCGNCGVQLVFRTRPPGASAMKVGPPGRRDQVSSPGETEYRYALRNIGQAGVQREVIASVLEAVKCGHRNARDLLKHAYCPTEKRRIKPPNYLVSKWSGFESPFWGGRCPNCNQPLCLLPENEPPAQRSKS